MLAPLARLSDALLIVTSLFVLSSFEYIAVLWTVTALSLSMSAMAADHADVIFCWGTAQTSSREQWVAYLGFAQRGPADLGKSIPSEVQGQMTRNWNLFVNWYVNFDVLESKNVPWCYFLRIAYCSRMAYKKFVSPGGWHVAAPLAPAGWQVSPLLNMPLVMNILQGAAKKSKPLSYFVNI